MTSDNSVEWHPAKLLQTRDVAPDFALLILNQPLRNGINLRKLWRNCTRTEMKLGRDNG